MHALICSRTVLQKHSCSTYILLLAAANLSLLSLRREPFSALMLPHRSSMPFSNHLSCDALNSTLEIQFSGLGFFLSVVCGLFCSFKASLVKIIPSNCLDLLLPSHLKCHKRYQSFVMIFFFPSTCNPFLWRTVSSDITAVLARTLG